jgi:hypothetical protein
VARCGCVNFQACQGKKKLAYNFFPAVKVVFHTIGQQNGHAVSVGHMADSTHHMAQVVDHAHHGIGKSRSRKG